MVKGFSGQRSEIVQVYFLDVAKENDQVTPLIERAMAAIAKRGKGVPGGHAVRREIPASRDLLADLDQVLGSERITAVDACALLRDLAPDWAPYRTLNGVQLRGLLQSEHGVKVPTTGNKLWIDPVTVRNALARQSTADLDDDE